MMLPLPDWQPGVKQTRGPDIPVSVLQYGPEYRVLVYLNKHNNLWRVDVNGECLPEAYPTESQAKADAEHHVWNVVATRLADSVEFVRRYSPVSDTLVERLRVHGLTGPKHGLSREIGNLLLEASAALLLLGQPAQPEEPTA